MTIVDSSNDTDRDDGGLGRRMSDYQRAFEALAGLQAATHPTQAVDLVLTLAKDLTSAGRVGYLPQAGPPRFDPGPAGSEIDPVAAFDAVSVDPWGHLGEVCVIRVSAAGATLGVVVLVDVPDPFAAGRCAEALVPVCESLGRTLLILGETDPADPRGPTEPIPATSEPDPTTGVLSRSAALEVLEKWRRRCAVTGEQLTLVIASVDGATELRDRGRLADAEGVLRIAAHRLTNLMRRTDLLARCGTEEFLVAHVRQPGSMLTLASRVHETLKAPYDVSQNGSQRFAVSVGSVTADMVAGTAEDLVAAADRARTRNCRVREMAAGMATPGSTEDVWQGAIAALADGVIVQDWDGAIVAHNPASEAILGLPPGSLTDRSSREPGWQAIHPDGSPFPRHTHPGPIALSTGEPVVDVVMGICLPSAPTKWINVTAVPLGTSPEPGVAAVVSTMTDVTDAAGTRHAQAEGYSRLRQAIDAFPNPFFILDAERDADGRIVELRYAHLNVAATQLYGCRAEDVIGRGQIELFPSVLELGVFSRYVAVIETGRTDCIEIPWFDDNGVQGSFEVVASRVGDSVVLTATEISERRSLVSRLAASEAQFLSTFGDGAVPMALVREPIDSRSRIVVQVNASMCQFLGRGEDELLGPVGETTPPALGRVLADFDQLIMTANDTAPLECEFRHRSGKAAWAEVRLTELGDAVPGSRMWLVQCSDTTERHTIEDELAFSAQHDYLTGLPNMTRFIDEVRSAIDDMATSKRPTAAMIINLDDFKSVNSELGLEAGDAYLTRCGVLLTESVGPDDHVSRPGGDEFAILIRDIKDRRRLGALAESTLAALAEGVDLDGTRVSAPASIGLAVATRTSTPETLLSAATAAMREAKLRGGNRWTLAATPRPLANNILQIEAELRDAISGGGLVQRYQPLYNLRTGRLDSVEALARWTHPTHGVVPPNEFIKIAERRNLIGSLGDWALETACSQWALWHEQHGADAPAMAVNVSTRQLGQRRLARRLEALLAAFQMPADQLWLEVTESQAIHAEGPATDELAAIRGMGAHVSVDDFGTGFAGFGYLKALPADGLKLDKTFVDDVHTSQAAAAIATSMVSLGRGLGLVVVAEGIETVSQLAVMRALGADVGQGWLWSHARPAAEVEELIGVPESEVRA